MKAVTFYEFGGPEVLRIEERGQRRPGPGELTVRVTAAPINPTDRLMLEGAQASTMTDLKPPFVAGMEFSGRIAEVGEGVDAPVGAPVIGVCNPRTPSGGAQAQEIVVPASYVAKIRANIDLVSASTVPMNALTAILALEMLGLSRGQTLLVTGGAGMLGSYAIQLAHQAGLRVLANASEKDQDFLSAIGADVVLPRDAGFEQRLQDVCPGGVDGLIDGALIGNEVSRFVRTGRGAISVRKSYRIEDPRLKVGYVSVAEGIGDPVRIARIAKMLEHGTLKPRVAPNGVFPFTRAAEAYAMAERGGFRGRVVLTFD